jgi:hypothetical protein
MGFSTHGSTELILQLINTNVFEYVNLHYHYFGSYTASGGGKDGDGNLDCVKLLHDKNMGIFVISPFDKGGRLYTPSHQLRSLTLPDMEPMSFASYWTWNHHRIVNDGVSNGSSTSSPLPLLHTYTVGAGRPSDLDQPAVAAYLHMTQNELVVSKLNRVVQRLNKHRNQVLGEDWVNSWWKGLPKSDKCSSLVEHNQIVWMYNNIKAFGMYEFAKARYNSLELNYYGKWNDELSPSENIEKIGKNGWGYVPGLPLLPSKDYSDDLRNVPIENRKKVVEAELFVYNWCRDRKYDADNNNTSSTKKRTIDVNDDDMNGTVTTPINSYPIYTSLLDSANYTKLNENEKIGDIPKEWATSYDMRAWPDYPDQPKRN